MPRGGHYSIVEREGALTSQAYNEDHQRHIDNLYPEQIDDFSETGDMLNILFNPYANDVAQRPTNLAEEIAALRFMIRSLTGKDRWYEAPQASIEDIEQAAAQGTGLTPSQIAALTRVPTAGHGSDNVWAADGNTDPAWVKITISMLASAVLSRLLPSGGDNGQVLEKSADADYAVTWGDKTPERNLTSLLTLFGIPAYDEANRGQILQRTEDESGFEFVDNTGGAPAGGIVWPGLGGGGYITWPGLS